MRVLLVEDDLLNLNLALTRLSLMGHHVAPCETALGALAMVEAGEPFDLAVVDLRMPGINGIELIDRLRANPATASLPILVVSGEPGLGMVAGADHFLQKPYTMHELIQAIAVTMAKRPDQRGAKSP